ncbi:MAG TPA: thioredoxin family protein [Lysobacter sp.]|nr:thioredoxin family protein [Lysobacter sp.]
MAYERAYRSEAPTREAVAASRGPLVLEFGTGWCGHCIAAQPHIEAVLGAHPDVPLHKIEDGPGRVLGRAFRVKLWPTLVFLRDGVEVARVVRPQDAAPLREALDALRALPSPQSAGELRR